MKLIVNGEPRDHDVADLADLFALEARDKDLPGPDGIAIALNGRVVRRAAWAQTPLSPEDRVEIVRAMQGG